MPNPPIEAGEVLPMPRKHHANIARVSDTQLAGTVSYPFRSMGWEDVCRVASHRVGMSVEVFERVLHRWEDQRSMLRFYPEGVLIGS